MAWKEGILEKLAAVECSRRIMTEKGF